MMASLFPVVGCRSEKLAVFILPGSENSGVPFIISNDIVIQETPEIRIHV